MSKQEDDTSEYLKIDCIKVSRKEIQIMKSEIIRSEQKTGGLLRLGARYTSYLIGSEYLLEKSGEKKVAEVYRRYSDFEWLEDYLAKQQPGQMRGCLLNKKRSKQNRDKKRIDYLQLYLNSILNNPVLKSDLQVTNFFL